MGDSSCFPAGMWRIPKNPTLPNSTSGSSPTSGIPTISNLLSIGASISNSAISSNSNNNSPSPILSSMPTSMSLPIVTNPNPSPTSSQGSMRVKRGHVSKACTNCRKMHAGCDKERPCSRCVFNGWESTCADTPRKKRVSKKIKQHSLQSPENKSQVSQPKEENSAIEKSDRTYEKIWVENSLETELFSELNEYNHSEHSYQSRNEENNQEEENGGLNFLPENLLITEMMHHKQPRVLPRKISAPLAMDATQMPAPIRTEPMSYVTKKDLALLFKEMTELKEKNRSLESKLETVTQELSEVKERQQQMIQVLSSILLPQNQLSLLHLLEPSTNL